MPSLSEASSLSTSDRLSRARTHAALAGSAAAAVPSLSSLPAASPSLPPSDADSVRWTSSELDLSNKHRVLSAACGAMLTSLVVTPFDVIRVRLQAQINSIKPAAAAVPSLKQQASQMLLEDCAHYRLHTGLADSWCNNCLPRHQPPSRMGGSTTAALPELRFNGALDAAVKLVKYEGLSSLWRGLSPTILMSIPSTVVYFSLYDHTKIAIARVSPQMVENLAGSGWGGYTQALHTFSPLLAGVMARAFTTTLVSPIELVRTKSQSLRQNARMLPLLRAELRKGGPLSLWRGVGPTLMRDVPFSAVYWSAYEYNKSWLLGRWGAAVEQQQKKHGHAGWHGPDQRQAWIYASFLAGASSGMLAATITHPFDLIKTRRQIELYHLEEEARAHARAGAGGATAAPASATAGPALKPPHTTLQVARTIIREEGYRGLFSGLSARITKIAPSCAIMISTYEVAKLYFGEQQRRESQRANAHAVRA